MKSEAAKGDQRIDGHFRCRCGNQSASARCTCNDNASHRRSASPSSNVDARHNTPPGHCADGPVGRVADLFVRGIHPDLTEINICRVFEKYGEVEHCRIMRHSETKCSRGFGFVGMATSKQAEAAQQGLHGRAVEGSRLIIEKSRPIPPRQVTPDRNAASAKRAIRRGNYERGLIDHDIEHIGREYNRCNGGGTVTTVNASMTTGLVIMTSIMEILSGTVSAAMAAGMSGEVGLSILVLDVVTYVANPVQVTLEASP
ncbi:hypothetical protein Purlil1_13261 [Purpureocillium lilacinum]|uniref:RRM domain-containing protein n=1 Tax=Purpureocillium lilacinum TaxID=33203 RepID=A0ABR0BES8_PURLI|nr:hypothetical protein Purlil1_13261 [Purpureocillium lilacinum]